MAANPRGPATRFVVACMLALASGCAASKQSPAEPSSPRAYGQAGYPQAAGAPQQQYAPAPPPPSAEAAPSTPAAAPPPPSAAAPDRQMALRSAANEVESSQRELDVAGSDCRNACRALGSMDRAAGRLCELSHGAGEENRCVDAKQRVYSARDRVRTNCGSCPNGPSVERAAPIPSLR